MSKGSGRWGGKGKKARKPRVTPAQRIPTKRPKPPTSIPSYGWEPLDVKHPKDGRGSGSKERTGREKKERRK
jgi:hypothetical protein